MPKSDLTYLQSTITIRKCKNNDYGAPWWSVLGIWLEILNNFEPLENQNLQRENYLEFCQTAIFLEQTTRIVIFTLSYSDSSQK